MLKETHPNSITLGEKSNMILKKKTLWKPNFYYITANTHTNLTLCQALLKILCINSFNSHNKPIKLYSYYADFTDEQTDAQRI